MMTAESAKYAAELVDAYSGLEDVRNGLTEKAKYGRMCLEIGAFEDQGDSGGVGHGSTLVPPKLARKILESVEMILGDELATLGVSPPRKKRSSGC